MNYMHSTSLSTLFYFSCLNLRERALRPLLDRSSQPRVTRLCPLLHLGRIDIAIVNRNRAAIPEP